MTLKDGATKCDVWFRSARPLAGFGAADRVVQGFIFRMSAEDWRDTIKIVIRVD
jgi:hypothetical protein